MPGCGMEKTFRFVVSVFFLATLLSPAALRFPNLRIELSPLVQAETHQRAARLEEVVYSQAARIAERELGLIVRDKLYQMGINAEHVAISFITSSQGELTLGGVHITLDPIYQGRESELAATLEAELGGPVFVYTGQG